MKNMMEYKGYFARVEYSDEDRCFFGSLEGVADVIGFEGSNVDELESGFHDAVNDYLDMCERVGKDPQKAYKGSFNIRINPELHKRAAITASSRGISLNQLIENAVESYVQ